MSVDFPAEEEVILQRWREINAFRRQVELSQGRKPYTFYDGPPFATGLPHYGHLLASTIKDIIPRYWSMKGHFVERRFGWDTHGVPIEYEIDKKLGMSGLDAVKKIGIEKYNEECRAIVMRFASEWRETVERLGRWIDFDNDYKVWKQNKKARAQSRIWVQNCVCVDTDIPVDNEHKFHGICVVGVQTAFRQGLSLPWFPCHALLDRP